jgi:hypothetical protein
MRINKMTLDILVASSRLKDIMMSMEKLKSRFLRIAILKS